MIHLNKFSPTLNAFLLFILISLVGSVANAAQENHDNDEPIIFSSMASSHPVWAKSGMVSSQEAVASKVGLAILKQGGNAVDAAVAVGFSLAVTLPRAGNLGGGGFMLVYIEKTQEVIAIDYREMAPSKAHKDMFLDPNGNAVSGLSRSHGLSVGVPGTVMGLELALKKYGTMTLAQVVAPAIELAEQGFIVTPDLAFSLNSIKKRLTKWPSTEAIFYKPEGQIYLAGDRLIQADLAKTLKQIAKNGSNGFYKGEVAKQIAQTVQAAGGIMSVDDLANYKAVIRKPLMGEYRGYQIAAMPAPSSGGAHVLEILNIMEGFPVKELGHNSAANIHYLAEAMKRAYVDRSEYLGDPDFVQVPEQAIINKKYAEQLRAQIDANKVTPSETLHPGKLLPYESNETTHYSVVDQWGNAVANTYTLNFSYGSGIVAQGTGVLLNNEMDDFSAKPGTPNGFGLIGGDKNAVESGKRPLSSMSPTIVFKHNKPYLVTGSPGGSRIITTTLQVIMNVIDHDMNIADATASSRVHHQWMPDELRVEPTLSIDTINLLKAKGHNVVVQSTMGSTQSIVVTEQGLFGSSDPRRDGALTVGY